MGKKYSRGTPLMKHVLILVEGLTEELFVKNVLNPHLWTKDINTIPKIVTTKRVKAGGHFKGGVDGYQKVENDLKLLLGDSSAISVTTFIDYYALPTDFPGMATRPNASPLERVEHVESEWQKAIGNKRFHPFLMLHEFEALLFTSPVEICKTCTSTSPKLLKQFESIRSAFKTPEDINDNPNTAPSKRIEEVLPSYQKPVHGSTIAKRIGLINIRKQCPHFDKWLTFLENVS